MNAGFMNDPNWIMGLANMANKDPQEALLKHAKMQEAEVRKKAVAAQTARDEAKYKRDLNAGSILSRMAGKTMGERVALLTGAGYSPQEAIAMAKSYETKKEKPIKAGDGRYHNADGSLTFPDIEVEDTTAETKRVKEEDAERTDYYAQKKEDRAAIRKAAKPKKYTGKEQDALTFARRMRDSNTATGALELNINDEAEADPIHSTGTLFNWMQSDEEQVYLRNKEDFITGLLRDESGATIGSNEFKREEKKFFPQLNDSDEVIADKRRARKEAAKDMARETGGLFEETFHNKKTHRGAQAIIQRYRLGEITESQKNRKLAAIGFDEDMPKTESKPLTPRERLNAHRARRK